MYIYIRIYIYTYIYTHTHKYIITCHSDIQLRMHFFQEIVSLLAHVLFALLSNIDRSNLSLVSQAFPNSKKNRYGWVDSDLDRPLVCKTSVIKIKGRPQRPSFQTINMYQNT